MTARSLLLLIAVAFALLTPLPAAQAQQSARLLEQSAQVDFPASVTFRVRAQSPTAITRAEVRFATDHQTCARAETSAFADLDPSTSVDAQWTWDLRQGGVLPPGAAIRYHWLLYDQNGIALDTPWETVRAQDAAYQWQHVGRGNLDLYWYKGDAAFAGALLDSGEQAIARVRELFQREIQGPISVYIYASGEDLLNSLVFPDPWTGGQALSDYNTVVIGIAPESLGWGVRAIAHELTHVAIGQAVFNCSSGLPTWLNEGLATYNEDATGEPSSGYAEPLKQGIREDRLLSVPGLSEGFPADSEGALLAYGESNSLASYLLKSYGDAKMRQLLETFRQGVDADAALLSVYGFDQAGLDALWRAGIGAKARKAGQTIVQPLPTPIFPALEPYGAGLSPSATATPTGVAVVATPTPTFAPAAAKGGGCNR